MKILYIYDKFPNTYQAYLINTLDLIKKIVNVKSFVYDECEKADYNFVSYGFRDRFQRVLFKLKLSKYPSLDIKLMMQFDFIHIQHSYLWRKILPFKYIRNRPKIIITLRGGDTYIKPWLDDSWKQIYSDNNKLIDAFVVMSYHQKEYLIQWGVPETKIHIVPVSFGLKTTAKAKYPNQNKLMLISVYRMTWEKNIEGTIQFARLLKEKKIPFEFDIYGDGRDLGQLYFLINKYKLDNSVFPKRKIENEELITILPKYDFLVHLSISESLGMSVIEAQSQGIPCIVSNSGGVPEAVDFGKMGIISDYNNYDYFVKETIKLWRNRKMYFSFSDNAINYANGKFSTDIELVKLISLYEKIN